MAYKILPDIEKLKSFIEEVKKNASGKKQQVLAEQIVSQFEKLYSYSKELTELNNNKYYGEGDSW